MTKMEAQKPEHPHRPRRAIRRLGLTAAVLLILIAIAAFAAYLAATRIPAWYSPADPAATSQQARVAEDKLISLQNWADAKHAYESAKRHGPPKAREPDRELVIAFTQSEINSLLSKWYGLFGLDEINGQKLDDVLRGPMVRIEKGRITLAGAAPMLGGRIVSLDFEPLVDGGTLQLKLMTVRTGNLPLPEFTWTKLRRKLIESLHNLMTELTPNTRFDNAGAANLETVSTVLAKQGIDSLSHRSTENVLFLPILSESAAMPVRLKSCTLEDGSITLVTEPLDTAQCGALLRKLRSANPPPDLTPSKRNTR